ncbi:MAG TPA: asparagine synthase (glutamine-hydrolyzing) [Polyangia bacterium]
MCGIAGFLSADPAAAAPVAPVRRMMAALAHRGPDAAGEWAAGPAVLGHRRLSIIDLSPEANQPIANEDGSVVCVANGEVYGAAALRRDLVARGHAFRSRSDSEVIVHLYEERGPECVHALRGMFAFAVWDGRRRRLLVARDRAGEKPLYYAARREGLYFASELPALLAGLGDVPGLDLAAIDCYLTLQYVPAPLTAFAGVAKLPAAHLIELAPGEAPRPRRYWRLRFAPGPRVGARDAVAEVRALLDEAVALRLEADVPLGAFLSGGLDSSTVVALMARHATGPVRTFSIELRGLDVGEVQYARLVAQRYHTEHHELVVAPDMVAILPELVRRYGEPFADASAVPTYYLARLTRRHVTVALSGDGGDEAFAGYTRYGLEALARALRRLPWSAGTLAGAALARLPAAGRRRRLVGEFGAHLGLPLADRYPYLLGHFTRRDKRDLLGPALRAAALERPVGALFDRLLAESDAADPVNLLLDLDTQTYLPDDILTKVDIASMAHALEVRAPFCDHVLLERLAAMPGRLKLRGMRGKHLLRLAVRDLVPAPIIHRRKQGFGLPLDRWLREELAGMARDLLTDDTARGRGLVDPRGVARLLAEHRAGVDHGDRLWNLLILELWCREVAEARPVPETPVAAHAGRGR